jgi:hypothetical protein
MKVAPWMPDKFEFQQNYPGGQQAYEQSMHNAVQNWQNQQGGPKGPRQSVLSLGLGSLFGQGDPTGQWPTISDLQQPQAPQDPWGVRGMGEQITGFGETLGGYGEQLGGFQETLGGYGEQLGGFSEQLGGLGDRFGKQMSGYGEQLGGLGDRLTKIEEGIGSLLENRGSGMGMNRPQTYGYSPYHMLLGGSFGMRGRRYG